MQADDDPKKSGLDEDRPQRLSEFLFPTLLSLKPGKRITKNVLKDAWSEVMGPQTGRHVKVVGFAEHKLRLSTREFNWYRTVQKTKGSIIDRLNSHMGSGMVEEVEVVFIGSVPPGQ